MATIIIANRPWSPGTQLTDQQMLAISAGIQIGFQYSANVLAQFEAQGGQAAQKIMTSLGAFARRMRARGRALPDRVNRVKRQVALVADRELVLETPVDTGRAR